MVQVLGSGDLQSLLHATPRAQYQLAAFRAAPACLAIRATTTPRAICTNMAALTSIMRMHHARESAVGILLSRPGQVSCRSSEFLISSSICALPSTSLKIASDYIGRSRVLQRLAGPHQHIDMLGARELRMRMGQLVQFADFALSSLRCDGQ